jgi:hypothetical protein
MPNINRPVRKHETNFRTKDGDSWQPFTDETHITLMINAFMEINRKVIWDKGILKSCNGAFAKLPGHQDFAAVWRDPGVWVSFNPNPDEGIFGITFKKDIAIAANVFKFADPVRWIAATLVHELAHVNGAPGGMDSKAAEATLPPCGFDDKFNPATVGMVRRPMRIEMA